MSTMLEQAIVDAAALRETAMKSAESSLIEKYSKEFKDTFEKLLEQEMQPATAAVNAEDPTGPVVAKDEPVEPQSAEPELPEEKKDVFNKVKTAFFDVDDDDEELVTINFNGLKAKKLTGSALLAAPPTQLSSQPSAAASPSPEAQPASLEESLELDIEELEEDLNVEIKKESYGAVGGKGYHHAAAGDEEEFEEEEEEFEFDLEEAAEKPEDQQASRLDQQATDAEKLAAQKQEEVARQRNTAQRLRSQADDLRKKRKASNNKVEPPPVYEEIELTEEELRELEEALMVDMKNVPEGYMGSHDRKAREFKKVALAAARGDKQRKRRENAKKTLGDLEINESKKIEKLSKSNKQLVDVLQTLKEQLEQTNLSNAKLLYTNKVLSNVSLNERQKSQIVENIAKAGSVIEAKAIYDTLQSTVQGVSQKTTKSLSEALNRGSTPFLVRKREPTALDDVMADRMKRLAGIK